MVPGAPGVTVSDEPQTAAQSVRERRVAEVVRQDLTIQDGAVVNFRVRLGISFKYNRSE